MVGLPGDRGRPPIGGGGRLTHLPSFCRLMTTLFLRKCQLKSVLIQIIFKKAIYIYHQNNSKEQLFLHRVFKSDLIEDKFSKFFLSFLYNLWLIWLRLCLLHKQHLFDARSLSAHHLLHIYRIQTFPFFH